MIKMIKNKADLEQYLNELNQTEKTQPETLVVIESDELDELVTPNDNGLKMWRSQIVKPEWSITQQKQGA